MVVWDFGPSTLWKMIQWGRSICLIFRNPRPWEVQKNLPPVWSQIFQFSNSPFRKQHVFGFQLGVWHPQQLNIRWALTQETEIWREKKSELKQQETQPLQINKTNSSKTQPSLNTASKFSSSDACLRKTHEVRANTTTVGQFEVPTVGYKNSYNQGQ